MVEIELDGMEEIINRVQVMGRAAKDTEEKAVQDAGKVILDEAINNLKGQVKARTGDLEGGLSMSAVKGSSGRRYTLIGIQKEDNSNIYYGKFIEWGASAHRIIIRRGKSKQRVVNHPGISAKPYLGPAYESKKNEAKEIMKRILQTSLGIK